MSTQQDKYQEAVRQLDRKAAAFQRAFSTPEGKVVMEALRVEFDPDVLCINEESMERTVVRAAQRDVIRYMELMINRSIKNDDVEG